MRGGEGLGVQSLLLELEVTVFRSILAFVPYDFCVSDPKDTVSVLHFLTIWQNQHSAVAPPPSLVCRAPSQPLPCVPQASITLCFGLCPGPREAPPSSQAPALVLPSPCTPVPGSPESRPPALSPSVSLGVKSPEYCQPTSQIRVLRHCPSQLWLCSSSRAQHGAEQPPSPCLCPSARQPLPQV